VLAHGVDEGHVTPEWVLYSNPWFAANALTELGAALTLTAWK